MQDRQGAVLKCLEDVRRFLDDNAAELPGIAGSGARTRLDDAITTLSGHATNQNGLGVLAQSATQQYGVLRETLLRDHMRPIAKIAAAELPKTPAVEPLRIPRGRLSAAALATAAKGMAKAAEQFSDVFTKAGMPADFIAQLTAASDAMMGALSDRSDSRGKRGGATQGLTVSTTDARRVIHMLDAFVKRAVGNSDPALIANWNMIKRVPLKTSVAKPNAPATTPSTPPGSSSAPAPTAPTPAAAPTPAPTTSSSATQPAAPAATE